MSSILVLAMLLSVFAMTVVAAAESEGGEGEGEDEEDATGGVTAVYNRNFSEGWDYGNGIYAVPRSQRISIDYEEDENLNYNYFMRLDGLTADDHGYFDILYGGNSPRDGYSILEFDIKTDDMVAALGNFLQMRHTSSGNFTMIGNIVNQRFTTIGADPKQNHNQSSTNIGDAGRDTVNYFIGELANQWTHVAYVFNLDLRVCPECHKAFSDEGIEDANAILCADHGKKLSEMNEAIGITVYYGYSSTFNIDKAVYNTDSSGSKDLEKTYKYDTMYVMPTVSDTAQIFSFRFSLNNLAGVTLCFDNLRVYNGSSVPIADLDPEIYGYGSLVNSSADKVIEIKESAGSKSDADYAEGGLAMKLGVDYALYAGEKRAILTDNSGKIYGAPVEIDGTVYVPLQAVIDYIGFPVFAHADGISYDISTNNGSAFIAIGRDSATVNGEIRQLTVAPNYIRDNETGNTYLVIALEDVDTIFDGYHATYDEMGLIVITETLYDDDGNVVDVVSRDTNIDLMLSLMKKFVVDYTDGDTYYDLVSKNTGFRHPYLLADADTFAALYAAYVAEEGAANYDATLKAYLNEYIVAAKEIYEIYAQEDANGYIGIKSSINMLNTNGTANGGYASNGRLTEATEHATAMRTLALAYQITHDSKYSDLAYDIAVALADWSHWGPGYVLDLANTATPYALTYDWLYNVWSADDSKDILVIERALYEKVLSEGYNISNGIAPTDIPVRQDAQYEYTTREDYWNAVTTNAMVITSLALLGANGDDAALYADIHNVAKWLIENNMKTLVQYGLDDYAPDGVFFAGPEFWQKTTDAFITTIWVINDTTGSDMGLLDLWGIYDTFYYAIYIEYSASMGEVAGETAKFDSGYSYWNYNDSIGGTLDTSAFFYASEILGDNTFAAYRVMQLKLKPVGYLDLLAYDKAYLDLDMSDFELPLDYVLEGCDAYVSRESYEKGSLYVGIMGNKNGGAFGQVDAGNFIYVNKGYAWFLDTGAENPDVAGYFTDPSVRYRYYRVNAEGANVVCVTTSQDAMPYGQAMDATGTVEEYVVNENGMYVIFNNKSIYGQLVAEGDAKRGMLVTNNKSTVVIQDEIKFDKVQTVFWIGHTAANITLSDDSKTAYLTQYVNGKEYILRATLVSRMEFTFDIMSASDFLLEKTMRNGESASMGGAGEYQRTTLQRLVIEGREQMSFECAVVLEMVENKLENDTADVQYEWTDMSDWKLGSSFEPTPEGDRNALLTDISDYSATAGNYIARGTAFGDKIFEFYNALAMVASAEETYRPSQIQAVQDIYADYLDFCGYREQYRAYMFEINKIVSSQKVLANGLGGIQ